MRSIEVVCLVEFIGVYGIERVSYLSLDALVTVEMGVGCQLQWVEAVLGLSGWQCGNAYSREHG